jgi:hypothetical protein
VNHGFSVDLVCKRLEKRIVESIGLMLRLEGFDLGKGGEREQYLWSSDQRGRRWEEKQGAEIGIDLAVIVLVGPFFLEHGLFESRIS